MQAFVPIPSVFTVKATRTTRAIDYVRNPNRSINHRQCRIIVSAQTADEVRPVDDLPTEAPLSPPLMGGPVAGSGEEDSEAAVQSVLDDNPIAAAPLPNVSAPPVAPSTAPPSFATRLNPPPRPTRPPPRPTTRGAPRTDRPREGYTPPPPFVADPNATYFTKCGGCTAAYELIPSQLGRGMRVSCSVCANVWYQKPDRLLIFNADKQKFGEYPIEKKDELIAERARGRRENPRTPYREGGREGSAPRFQDRRPGGETRERRPGGGGSGGGGGGGFRNRSQFSVFLGNLAYTVTEEELRGAITSEFNVLRISVIKDMETGRSKGFAFCDLGSEDEVEKLVNYLDGYELQGREISARVGKKNT